MMSLVIFAVALTSAAASTSLYSYTLTDSSATANYPEGTVEYHCFDFQASDRTYVRGTYGNFGYFEGAVDASNPLVFHVNWFETASLTPTMGAATLTYSADYLAVTGPFWSTGTSDIMDSYNTWDASSGTLIGDDSTQAGQDLLLEKCFYPGSTVVAARSDVSALSDTVAVTGTSEQGENTLCAMPAGPAGGSWLGTYTFEYDDAPTEKGNYGTNPFSFWGQSGMGFVGTWHASTGDFKGNVGSNIYMVVGSSTKTYLVGFYCEVNDDGERTDCFSEHYEVTEANQNANNCPSFYRMDKSLDPLYEFASEGSSLGNGGGSSARTTVALSILFGVLTAALLAAVIFLCTSRMTETQAHAPVNTK